MTRVVAVALVSGLTLACGVLDVVTPQAQAVPRAELRPPVTSAPPVPVRTATAVAATPTPGGSATALPPDAQFGVPLVRVGCHATPQAQADVVAFRQVGQVLPLAAVLVERAEVWYREATGPCWIRAIPGPAMLVFSTRRRAECFALPPGPAAAAVTDCVTIDGASDRADAASGEIAASAPPGSRCAAYRVVNESGRLRVQNLPATRADARGLVAWTWPRAGEVAVESSTITVMCIPGGAASVTLNAR